MKKNILLKSVFAFVLLAASLQSFAAGLSFTANVTSGCAPLSVTFTNTSSDVTAYRYEWNFGDGSPVLIDTMPTTVNHIFTTPGSYGVFVNVYTIGGAYIGFTYCQNGNINPSGPSIDMIDSTCIGDLVNFCAFGNNIMSPSWNFGDPGSGAANTSTQYCATHAFSSNGAYTITLNANSPCGPMIVTKTIYVSSNTYPNPVAWYGNSNYTCPGQPVQMNTNVYNTYSWNFGDPGSGAANTSALQSPLHSFSGLGDFTPTVTVTNGCGNSGSASTTIHVVASPPFPTTPGFSLHGNTPICPSSMVNFDAPSGYTFYEWNYGDGSPLDTTTDYHTYHMYGATLGTYPASVRVVSACGNDTLLNLPIVVSTSAPFPNFSSFSLSGGPNPLCLGDAATVNAPQGYLNYNWDFGDGQTIASGGYHVTHTFAANGTYAVSCTITNNCGNDTTLNGSIVVNGTGSFPSGLQIQASPTTSCPDDIIEFKVNQSGFASYAWDFGDGITATSAGERIQHAYALIGTYPVTCVITNGCGLTTTLNGSINVTGSSPVNPDLSLEAVQNPACPNDEVFFFVQHGQPNYTYVWNYGDASAPDTTIGAGSSHFYATAGTYNVSITAINGCGLTLSVATSVVVSGGAVPTLHNADGGRIWGFPGGNDGNGNSSVGTAGCIGDAVTFYFQGEAASNVYDFGDGTTATAVDQLVVYAEDGTFPVTVIRHAFPANGLYLVTLTITNGCGNSVTDTMTIRIGGNLPADGEMTTSPPPFITCAPILFLAFGGESYDWDFGDGATLSTTSSSVSHTFATAGVHVVTVVVTNGCGNSATVSRSLNVTGMGGPAVTLTSSATPTCVSGSNGAATISVTSGDAPYTYAWNDAAGQTGPTATGLPSGLYYATVTDNNGCASTLAVNINDPAPIATSVSTTTTACGAATGTATVSVTGGGTAPFTYLWSTGITTATATGMATGPYTVMITDANSCITTANASVSENGGSTVTLNAVTNALCNGSSNGAIDINVSGGTAPYTYLWSNGSTAQDPAGLAAGNYSVTVTDNSGCHATLNVNVNEPSAIIVQTAVAVSPTCGNFDGSATASATGGTGPYTYQWDPGTGGSGQTTQTATGLPAGTYTVTVTDATGCTKDASVDLSNSNAPNITAVVTNVSCFNGNNGAVNITVTGGTSPYLYTWSVPPPQTNSQDVNTLLPGNYLVFVNDAHGCMSYRSYTITQPALLTAAVTNTGVTCGNVDGTATATPAGGNTSFTYSWTGGQTTQTATGLATGNYTVTVTDNRGCVATGTTTLAATTLVQDICMVTVDTGSTHNIIFWEKPAVTNLDSFKIYREDVTNVYTLLGTVSYDSLSEYHDYGADPNTTTKRYKMTAKDNCGGESVKSNYHNTIYIIDNGAGQFSWNPLYTIENGANPVDNYRLMRDDNNTNVWNQVAITAGTQNTLVDPAYMSYPNGRWYVETVWGITCTPTRATVNTTRSNIKHAAFTVGVDVASDLSSVALYPNPAKEEVTLALPALNENVTVRIMNAMGQIVYDQNVTAASNAKTTRQINTENFAKGVYTLSVETKTSRSIKKLVIN